MKSRLIYSYKPAEAKQKGFALIATSLIVLGMATSFIGGTVFQFKRDESKVNEIFEYTTQCDLPLNDGTGRIVEVDCMTLESYNIVDNYFFDQLVSDKHLMEMGLIAKKCYAEDYSEVPCDYWTK